MNNIPSSFQIPSIDGGFTPVNPQTTDLEQERAKLDRLINAPSSISGWALLGKLGLGLVVGALMSVILFMIMGAFGLAVGGGSPSGAEPETHPLAWLILLFLAFLVSFVGNLVLVTLYSVFFSQKYTKISKTTGLLLLTNSILFAGMIALFLLLQPIATSEVVLFVLYVCISLFVSFSQIEFVVNPNYAASSLIGNVLGFCMCLVIFAVMRVPAKLSVDTSSPYMLIWISTMIAFPIMIFGQGIWEIIYAKMYENGANPFYLTSQAELDTETILENQQQELANENINVDI